MNLHAISLGNNPPDEVNVIIEVPMRSDPVKYEIDKESGAIFVDRILYTTMFYPCNYGFIPHTLAHDGDPVDVMVIGRIPIQAGAVMPVRPIGVLRMEDEAGGDEKILAVPTSKVTRAHDRTLSYKDVPEIDLLRIAHFFEHYKDLEPEKWVRVGKWEDIDSAHRIIKQAIQMEIESLAKK